MFFRLVSHWLSDEPREFDRKIIHLLLEEGARISLRQSLY